MTEPRAVRLALAAIAACVTATLLYAILRVVQAVLFTEPDPALIIWSEHAGYFWRVWTVVYAAGMVGIIAYLAAGRDAARTARVLAKALVIAAVLITVQGLLVP